MATGGGGGADLLATLSEDLLRCEVCREEFDMGRRPPRVLPCYHSYCGECVERLGREGSVKCPRCRQVAPADRGFPMDTTRVALLEWRQSVRSQEGVACGICSDGTLATSRCQDCTEYMCSECTTNHSKYKSMRNHTVVLLSEAAKSPEKLVPSSETCERHSDEKLKLFCLTCAKAVCSICALTLHLKGHEFVELESVLDDKKKKVLSVCGELEEAQRIFQKKAEESEASLERLGRNHKEAESQVQETFSCVISAALERQAEVLEELTARVKADCLRLEEQLANFRSLQAATQSAADYGRRLVSTSVASHVVKQGSDLQRTAADLKKKLTTPVAAAPTYKVETVKLKELKALLKTMGRIDSVAFAQPLDLPISFPSIKLDGRHCHPDCAVSADGCSLSNQPQSPPVSQAQRFMFSGTCGTEALPGQTCYWQVRVKAAPSPRIAESVSLCECGVASMEILQAPRGLIADRGIRALTVAMCPNAGSVNLKVWQNYRELFNRTLTHFNPDTILEHAIGFLLDVQRGLLTVIDVCGAQTVWKGRLDTSQPLWPCVSVLNAASVTHASVSISAESGEHVTLTPAMVNLLRTLVK